MEPHKNGKNNSSNMERLRELNDILTYNHEDANELLIKVNDELADMKEELNNGKENNQKIEICRTKVDSLINKVRNSLKNATKG